MILKLFLLLMIVSETVSLMCYHCSETTEDPRKNKCVRYIRTMNRYRERYIDSGSLNQFVKNCTGFQNLSEDQIFCGITRIELGGNIRSFIRGCTNDKNFFSDDIDAELKGKVQSDNQTTCVYTGQGYLACVTFCQGDFCNGFVSKATQLDLSYHALFVSLLIAVLLTFY